MSENFNYELLSCNDRESDLDTESDSIELLAGDGVKKVRFEDMTASSSSENLVEKNKFHHGSIKHPTSYIDTFINFFKSLVGTGIFTIPSAFVLLGYVGGSIGLFLCSALSLYCEKILVDTQVVLAKKKNEHSLNYQETVKAALTEPSFKSSCCKAGPIKNVIKLLINIVTFGSLCVYILVIAQNTKAILDSLFGERKLSVYMLYLLPPLIITNLIKNLKFLVPFSLISNIVIILSIVSVFVNMVDAPHSFIGGRPFIINVKQWPQFAGTIFFSITAITNILPLMNEMKKPAQFNSMPCGVLFSGTLTVMILNWIFGLVGYLRYGESVNSNITLNLPACFATDLIKGGQAVAILLTTPLNNYVLFEILEADLLKKCKGVARKIGIFTIRIGTVVSAVGLTMAIPNLNLLVSLIGSGANIILAMTAPAIIHLISIPNRSLLSKSADYAVIVLSIIIMISGTIENLMKVFELLSKHNV